MEKLDTIKEAINEQKIDVKSKLRRKWQESENATLNIALYKLAATEEERAALTQQKIDHTSGGEPIKAVQSVYSDNS